MRFYVLTVSYYRYSFLPDTIITCQSYAPFIKYYREILGKVILHDSPDDQSTGTAK